MKATRSGDAVRAADERLFFLPVKWLKAGLRMALAFRSFNERLKDMYVRSRPGSRRAAPCSLPW